MKRLLFLLMLVPFVFAAPAEQWQVITGLAILVSGLILVALYLAASMGVRELEFVTREEFYQLIMTAVMAGAIIGAAQFMDKVSLGFVDNMSLQQKAFSIINSTLSDAKTMQEDIFYGPSETIAAQGAKSAYCSFMSTGINIAACGGYRMLSTPLTTAYQLTGIVISELYAMSMLLDLSQGAFAFFIPFGIFLRAFKFSRGAGGLFIGLGIAFYFVLPLAIVAVDELLIKNYTFNGKDLYTLDTHLTLYNCDEWYTHTKGEDGFIPSLTGDSANDLATDIATGGITEIPDIVNGYHKYSNLEKSEMMFDDMQPYLKQNLAILFIRGVFLPVIALLLMVTSIRVLTALGGAEIDVSLLSKIA